MIALDKSEARSNSKTILPEGAILLDWLEEMTGADAIISPLEGMPIAQATFFHHIAAGAVLVQIKHGNDLVSSIGNRLNESLSKMVKMTRAQWQRVLVPVGFYRKDPRTGMVAAATPKEGEKPYYIIISGAPKKWEALQSALWRWRKRGGCIEPMISTAVQLAKWMQQEERDLKSMIGAPTKEVWHNPPRLEGAPDPDDPLQEVKIIKDGRIILAAFPSVGKGRAQDIWDFNNGRLYEALIRLSDEDMEQPKGVGKKTVEKVREMLGLTGDSEIFRLSVEVNPKYFVED